MFAVNGMETTEAESITSTTMDLSMMAGQDRDEIEAYKREPKHRYSTHSLSTPPF